MLYNTTLKFEVLRHLFSEVERNLPITQSIFSVFSIGFLT